MKRILQKLALRTQVAPFTWAYGVAYQAALALATRRLRAAGGVRAIYLIGGLLDEPVYGLSDIDLVVLVDDNDGRALLRVREVYTQLAASLPVLAPVQELSLFSVAGLAAEAARRPRLQYRLGGHRPRRLLFGEDLLADLSMTASRPAQALAEIGLWWHFLARHRREGDAGLERANLARKMVADVQRAVIWDREGRFIASRRDTQSAGGEPPGSFHQLWSGFHQQIREYLNGARAAAEHELRTDLDAWSAFVERHRQPLAGLRHRFGERAVVAVPNLGFTADIDGDHPGTAVRVHLRLGRLPGDDELTDLDRLAGQHPSLHLFVEHDDVIYPLADEPRYGVGSRGRTPELFPDGAGRAFVDDERRHEIEAILRRRDQAAGAWALSPEVWRLDARQLASLVCTAVEARRGGARFLTAPAQLLEFVPENEAVAALAARLDAGTRIEDVELRIPRLRALVRLVRGCYGAAAADLEAIAALPERLTLSVVIPTRNRAELLRSALASLAGQTRAADEIVVVDNGSTDHTKSVAQAAQVVYRFLAEPSIPAARNLGADTARGDVIAYIDDDEVVDPRWLERVERAFLRDPEIGVVGGRTVGARAQTGFFADFYREYMGGP